MFISLLFFLACSYKGEVKTVYNINNTFEISIGDNLKIIIPKVKGKFDSCKHYSDFEIWKGNEMIYQDTAMNEYIFLCNSNYSKVRHLKENRSEILIEIFDGPDINKTLVIYLKNGKYECQKLLPYFDSLPHDIDNDGVGELFGIMYTIEGYGNGDSSYYNPTLYYEVKNDGIELDTVLTKKKIIEVWGGFYGYEQSDKIILPFR
jgi:hypothetical protein